MKYRHYAKTLALGISLGLMALVAAPSEANAAAYIKIGDIKGESMDRGHRGEIDVLSWSWGMSQSGQRATAGRGGNRNAPRSGSGVGDLSFTKHIDKASPKLQQYCNSGEHIPVIVLTLPRGRSQEFMTYELKNVKVTSCTAGSSGAVPTEDFSLNFEEIKVTYDKQGKDGATQRGGWDGTYKGKRKGNVEYDWKVEEGER
jgi:type VI secretion system secreted protein Hcp